MDLSTSLKNKGAFPSDIIPVFKELGIKEKANYSSSLPTLEMTIMDKGSISITNIHSFVQEIFIQDLFADTVKNQTYYVLGLLEL